MMIRMFGRPFAAAGPTPATTASTAASASAATAALPAAPGPRRAGCQTPWHTPRASLPHSCARKRLPFRLRPGASFCGRSAATAVATSGHGPSSVRERGLGQPIELDVSGRREDYAGQGGLPEWARWCPYRERWRRHPWPSRWSLRSRPGASPCRRAAQAQHTKLSLESIGPDGGNGSQAADLVGAVSVGKRSVIRTAESLVAADTDGSLDLYDARAAAPPCSTGPSGGNGAFPRRSVRSWRRTDRCSSRPRSSWSPADTDNALDVYRRNGRQHDARVSTGSSGRQRRTRRTPWPTPPRTALTSSSGPRVAGRGGHRPARSTSTSARAARRRWSRPDRPAATGTPGRRVRGHLGGRTACSSRRTSPWWRPTPTAPWTCTSATTEPSPRGLHRPAGANGAAATAVRSSRRTASTFFFGTAESLVAADTDDNLDVYERSGGTTTIHSIGPTAATAGRARPQGDLGQRLPRVHRDGGAAQHHDRPRRADRRLPEQRGRSRC